MDERKLSSQQAGSVKIEAEGQLRDRLARERTKLAIERTFLAYVRTALAFVVVGIPASFMFETLAIQALGVMSIVVGIALAAFSIYRYASVKRSLQDLPPSDGDDTDE
ncbi:YidH family protein [Nitrospira sp. Nam74]